MISILGWALIVFAIVAILYGLNSVSLYVLATGIIAGGIGTVLVILGFIKPLLGK